jgi:hypothetical protein
MRSGESFENLSFRVDFRLLGFRFLSNEERQIHGERPTEIIKKRGERAVREANEVKQPPFSLAIPTKSTLR